MSYNVKLDIFEGPFDLLVYLIEKSQMDIYDIQISVITSQYLEHLDVIKKLNVDVVSEFLVLAATLIEIKSKMLLPSHKDEEGVLEEDDPRTELVQKILEYKKFKHAVVKLQESSSVAKRSIYKVKEDMDVIINQSSIEREVIDLDIDDFVDAFNAFLKKRKKISDIKKRYQEIEGQRISIEDKIHQLKIMLNHQNEIMFSEIIMEDDDKHEIIVTFVAVLELLKQRIVVATQQQLFDEIKLVKLTEEVS